MDVVTYYIHYKVSNLEGLGLLCSWDSTISSRMGAEVNKRVNCFHQMASPSVVTLTIARLQLRSIMTFA